MLWIKSLHIIAMVTWFAGLFYLPRLFVYHSLSEDQISIDRFKIMERKLCYSIMTPGGILTIVSGLYLWLGYGFSGTWLTVKLLLVLLIIVYHGWCIHALRVFRDDKNIHGHKYYRMMNELPVLALFAIIILVVVKPF